MSLLVSCESLSKSYGSHHLFQEISLGIFEGDKIGIVGPNGTGKSTFLKIIAGLEAPDSGSVAPKRSIRIGYVPQTATYPSLSVKEILLDSLSDDPMLDHQQRFTKTNITLGKLGFENPSVKADELSGGWKKRLDIAKQLVKSPDLILFDEPTNHLDLEGILWLEKFLLRESFAFAVISHDRYFLQNVTNRMIEFNKSYPKGIFSIEGNYSNFLEKREEYLSGQLEYQKSLTSRVRGEVEWLKQNPKARTTKAQSRIQQADRLLQELSQIKARTKQTQTQIDFASTDRLSHKLLAAKNLSISIGEKDLFAHLDFILSPGMRMGIVGANGTGKTTLLKILAGELHANKGTIKYADGVRIVYFDQHRTQIDPKISLRRALAPDGEAVNYRGQNIHVNSWCKRFLFTPERLDLPFGYLSGGEKARVLIARLMLQPADILLLDEPTNDLDITTLEILEDSLLEFPGSIVLITHDRCMMNTVCNTILGLGVGKTPPILADISQWEAYKEEEKKKAALLTKEETGSKKTIPKETLKKKLSYQEKIELEQMESNILITEKQLGDLQNHLNDPALSSDALKLQAACNELQAAQEKLDKLYLRWEELESKRLS